LERHQEQLRNCGKHNLNFLRSYRKKERKQKKQGKTHRRARTQNKINGKVLQQEEDFCKHRWTAIFKLSWSSNNNTIAANITWTSYVLTIKENKRNRKKKTNTTKAIFAITDSYHDLQAKLEQQQKQQYDCGNPQNLNFLSSNQKRKQKKHIKEEEETQQQQQQNHLYRHWLIRTAIFKLSWSSSRSGNTIAANLRT
jgi:hypothetical protein